MMTSCSRSQHLTPHFRRARAEVRDDVIVRDLLMNSSAGEVINNLPDTTDTGDTSRNTGHLSDDTSVRAADTLGQTQTGLFS